ncbi:TIGR00375 family protein [Salinibacillus kushneri]|uniref:TIGR00375 family protein n=1 Tax=Salinibacillus kushneri TaxID=237682 RepID=A0A1I0HVU7_9BACI|nr:endonuclease Q family protein [Salinibacillus kushneri]SET88377.1 TIGR00375 family protein [Salinibacillus kushneri]
MTFQEYFVDLHVHIGRTIYGKPVKITASNSLTLTNILYEASERKGLNMIGIIDGHVPEVQEELVKLMENGEAYPLEGGGIKYGQATLILGSEIEIYDENCKGPIHVLCFFGTLEKMLTFTQWYQDRVKNSTLSSQRIYENARGLQEKVIELDGLFIPAHIFTPFKSVYGKGVEKSLTEILHPKYIDAVELGLSSDTSMADQISELHSYTFLTNSDAHSLRKIAREYQKIKLEAPTFNELRLALQSKGGRTIEANYGMNPLLGKYHSTVCANCLHPATFGEACPHCGRKKVIKGVSERIQELADSNTYMPERPPYIHQVPLEYLPKLGPKTLENMIKNIGTEMYILHKATDQELREVCSETIVQMIKEMRKGNLSLLAGGGGKYGKVNTEK